MHSLFNTYFRRTVPLAVVSVVMLATACSEDLDSGGGCPVLCPQQSVLVVDTVLEAVVLDTVITGNPAVGTEATLLLAARGDTLDTRVVLRFDSLPASYTVASGDTAIAAIDSAFIQLRVDVAGTRITDSVRIDLYDVDTTATDTAYTALLPLFRPDRLLGGTTFDTSAVRDSIRVFFDNARLLAKITAGARLRVGLRISSPAGAILSIGAFDGAQPAQLFYDPAPADTSVDALTVNLRSTTPSSDAQLQVDLSDYVIVSKAPPGPPPGVLSVGGLPARRTFLRFVIPSLILDSSTVLRATLLLNQVPALSADPRDSILILPQPVLAGEEVTDFARAAVLLSAIPIDTLRVAPGDSGARQLEMVAAVRQWAALGTTFRPQRAIVLRSSVEGVGAFEATFSSTEAAQSLRPRLRISYSRTTSFGIP